MRNKNKNYKLLGYIQMIIVILIIYTYNLEQC